MKHQDRWDQEFQTSLKQCQLWTDITVDIPFQQERVRQGCFCHGFTTDDDGRVTEYNMCPTEQNVVSRLQCEIFRDQVKLGLPLQELACMGAPDPHDSEIEYELIEDIECLDELDDVVIQHMLSEFYSAEGGEGDNGDG